MNQSHTQPPPLVPTAPRLVLIVPGKGIAVYSGRKCLAYGHGDFEYDALYIEEIRTADYSAQGIAA